MGYNTHYSLKLRRSILSNEEIIADLRNCNEEAKFAILEHGSTNDSASWYDHEQDMKEFSKRYPDIVFVLSGEGEDNEDIWKKYFKNGKMQRAEAVITTEEYDESKMV